MFTYVFQKRVKLVLRNLKSLKNSLVSKVDACKSRVTCRGQGSKRQHRGSKVDVVSNFLEDENISFFGMIRKLLNLKFGP